MNVREILLGRAHQSPTSHRGRRKSSFIPRESSHDTRTNRRSNGRGDSGRHCYGGKPRHQYPNYALHATKQATTECRPPRPVGTA